MKRISVLLILLIAAFNTACAPTGSSRYREGSNVGQETPLTVADERRLTQEALPKILQDYPKANNPELQKYISDLGMKIVRANNLEGNPYSYSFTVVDVPNVNAFALPAGAVFVTTPLIAMAENEAELAGVVSHEIGHVVARHTAERMYAMEKAQNKTWMYATGGAVVGAAVGLGLGSVLFDDASSRAKAAAIGGLLGAGGGLLAQKYGFLVNSREDEMEADRIGYRLAVGAGYDKDQVGRFYEKLLDMEKNAKRSGTPVLQSLSDAMSTHPPSDARVKQMKDLAANDPAGKGIVTSAGFSRARQLAAGMSKK